MLLEELSHNRRVIGQASSTSLRWPLAVSNH